VVQTFAPAQNEGGGFGGGHGQLSHLAPSYAVVLSLAMVGESESLDLIDRRSLSVETTLRAIMKANVECMKMEMAWPSEADRRWV